MIKIFHIAYGLKNRIIPIFPPHAKKLILTKPSIIINEDSWKKFHGLNIKTEYDILKCSWNMLRVEDYPLIIAYIGVCDKNNLKKLINLKFLQISSHGNNGFDNKKLYASDNVMVAKCKDVFAKSISQYCIAAYYMAKTFAFQRILGCSAATKLVSESVTVLIVGLGNIGTELAVLCKKQGWTVLAIKRSSFSDPNVDACYKLDQLKEISPEADFIINLLPETADTIGIYDFNFFLNLKSTAVFCNVGRASAVNESDLAKALKCNCLSQGTVFLDVANRTKFDSSKVVLTRHCAYKADDNDFYYDKFFTSQLLQFISTGTVNNRIL